MALLSSVPALAQDPRESARTARVDRLLAQAERAVAAGRLARALPLLRRAHEASPADPRAPLRLAELTLPGSPRPSDARPDAGAVRAAAEAQAALETLLRAATIDPEARRRAEHARQWAIALRGDHAGAIDALAATAGLQDAATAEQLRRAAALAVLRADLAAAQRALEAARRAMPQDPEIGAELATVLLARGRAPEAAALYEAVVARRPGDPDALRDLAGARMAAGDPRGAASILSGVARLLPDRSDVRLDLARAHLEAGDRERAIEAARAARERAATDDPEPSILLGQALAGLGRVDEARLALEDALHRRPGSARAWSALRALTPR